MEASLRAALWRGFLVGRAERSDLFEQAIWGLGDRVCLRFLKRNR